MKFLPLFGLLVLAEIAEARFEETLDQCKARYGEAVAVEGVVSGYRFEKNGITIRAHFGSGLKCDFIMFTRGKPFTEEEAKHLAQVNGRSRALTPIAKKNTDGAWIGTSGSGVGTKHDFVAILARERTTLVASDENGLQWWKAFDGAGKIDETPKSLEGF